jgi:hypothetical protein
MTFGKKLTHGVVLESYFTETPSGRSRCAVPRVLDRAVKARSRPHFRK